MYSYSTITTGLAMLFVAAFSVTAQAEVFSANVVGGFGTGSYPPGAEVFIEAYPYEQGDPSQASHELTDPDAPVTIFDRWSGDIASVEDIYSARTAFVMPAGNVTLQAVYKEAPRWTAPKVIAEIPPSHVGIIFAFHGSGGGANTFFGQDESVSFIQEATTRGFGVVALDSFNRVEKVWDSSLDPQQNVDLQRVAALRRDLLIQGRMSIDDPVYVLGVSNGGIFASLFDENVQAALDFPVMAAAIYISSGNLSVMQTTNVPTIFALAENDDATIPAITAFNSLLTRDAISQMWINPVRPLHPGSFWRIEGLDLADSQAIYDALRQQDVIDNDGYVVINPKDNSSWEEHIPDEYVNALSAIEDQLKIGYGEHGFMSDFNGRVLDFLANPSALVTMVPSVSSFAPASGIPGAMVTVYGDGFVGITSVTVGGAPADVSSVSGTQLRITVPVGATTGPITVTNAAGSSASQSDFVVEGPSISDFSPQSGPPGTTVVVNGAGFVDVTGVSIGGVSAEVLWGNTTRLNVKVPTGTSGGPVAVTNAIGTGVSQTNFSVSGPQITGIAPESGPPGTTVTISGTGFVDVTGVAVGGVSAEILSANVASLTIKVPAGTSGGSVAVTNAIATGVSPVPFTVSGPQISNISPTSGPAGTLVTVTGTGFVDVTDVAVGGISAVVVYANAASIVIKVPVGTAGGPVTVSNAIATGASPMSFSVSGPQIASISPASGVPGDRVTISGSAFVEVTSVKFGGVQAEILYSSVTALQVLVPAGAQTGAVTVTNYLGTVSSPVNFEVLTPTIASFSPTSGTAGTRVTISGTSFSGLQSVTFNGVPAEINAATATKIWVRVPTGASTGPIAVQTAAGSTVSQSSFTIN